MAIAATSWVSRTKNSLLWKTARRNINKVAGGDWKGKLERGLKDGNVKCESSSWVPHPRSGIYVPKGHESVMNDVPEGAASFDRTFWLRNIDGVEKPVPRVSAGSSDHKVHLYS